MFKSTVEYYKRKCNPHPHKLPFQVGLPRMPESAPWTWTWTWTGHGAQSQRRSARCHWRRREDTRWKDAGWAAGLSASPRICTKRLLVQLLAEQRAEDASGARSDAAVARTLKADGDGAGHSGGLLHEALAAAHAARHTTWECQAEIRKRCLGCGYWSFLS